LTPLSYKVVASHKYKTESLGYGVSLPVAKRLAEKHAEELKQRMAAKSRNEATDKQLDTLRKFRIAIPPSCTFGQAHDLIAARIAQLESRKGA
jgi:hypothetical protein